MGRDYNGIWQSSPLLRGAFWKVSSFLCFAGINGIVRYLSQTSEALGEGALPAHEVAFFQNLFGLIFLIPWMVQQGPESFKTQRPLLQGIRILLSAVGVVLWYTSLTYMPLAQAVALMFLGPLLTAVGARLFLGEAIGPERGLAIAIGFCGGGIITQSHFFSDPENLMGLSLAAFLPVLAATCFSGATLLIRRLAPYDSPQLSVVYLLIFMAPLLLVPTLLDGVWPDSWQWPWLLAMGALSAGANFFLNKAYSTAEVSSLIPYGFTKWFASALIGFSAFGEIPGLWTTTGAFVIMTAIVVLSFAEARRKRGRT